MTAPDLKPCPFCGGEARKWQDPSHSAAWFIGCDDGDRDCFGSIHWAETEAEAIAAWNTRATPAATDPKVKALERVNETPKTEHDAGNVLTPAPDAAIREAALREALEAMRAAGSFGRTAVEKHAALEQYCLDRDAILALLTEKPHDRA